MIGKKNYLAKGLILKPSFKTIKKQASFSHDKFLIFQKEKRDDIHFLTTLKTLGVLMGFIELLCSPVCG